MQTQIKNPKINRVLDNCIQQITNGNKSIIGFMLESNLKSGNQAIPEDLKDLRYGVSVTDGCIGWDDTENILTRKDANGSAKKEKISDLFLGRN